MTKDEFLSMIERVLTSLNEEKSLVEKQIIYYEAVAERGVSYESKELMAAKHQLSLINNKIRSVRDLVELPLYARIQAMSSVEIEDYKKIKNEEFEVLLSANKQRESQAKVRLEELKSKHIQLMQEFSTLFGEEREAAIIRGRNIQEEINKYESTSIYGVFPMIHREYEELLEAQKAFQLKSEQEIKDELSANLKNKKLGETIKTIGEFAKSDSKQFEASVSENSVDAHKMANLMSTNTRLNDDLKEVKAKMFLPYGLPYSLESAITKDDYYYDKSTNDLKQPQKIEEIINMYDEKLKASKEEFDRTFTVEKIGKLAGKNHGEAEPQVDLDFLETHRDKLPDNKLDALSDLVAERNKLNKKLIKTKQVKTDIFYTNQDINTLQSKIYKELIVWHNRKLYELFGPEVKIDYMTLPYLINNLEGISKDISSKQNAISQVRTNLERAKEEINRQKQNLEDRKQRNLDEAREMAGPQFSESQMPYGMKDANFNYEGIVRAGTIVYTNDVINDVQKEAQNQADEKEAELLGISVEELRLRRIDGTIGSLQGEDIVEELNGGRSR